MTIISYVACAILGYLLGAIPWALIIGEKFFHKDIREFGSHNLGGTNAGRVLGAKAGAVVILLDIGKVLLTFALSYLMLHLMIVNSVPLNGITNQLLLAGLMAIVGHCYPVFAQFRGGKAVSALAGFMIATNWLITLIIGLLYLIILKRWKMVSLSALVGTLLGTILAFIPFFALGMYPWLGAYTIYYGISVGLATILLWIRHRSNIQRILHHEERKITWMK